MYIFERSTKKMMQQKFYIGSYFYFYYDVKVFCAASKALTE